MIEAEKSAILTPPKELCFDRNVEETLKFIGEISEPRPPSCEGYRIVADCSKVKLLAPEVALCLRAELDRFTVAPPVAAWIQPKELNPLRSFTAADVHWRANIVRSFGDSHPQKVARANQVLSVGESALFKMGLKKHFEETPATAFDYLVDKFDTAFLAARPKSEELLEKLKVPILTALSEVIYNIKTHAYIKSSDHRDYDWWIGIFSMSRSKIVRSGGDSILVCCVDQGMSIPENLRKNIESGVSAIVQTNADPMGGINMKSDFSLLDSLMHGMIERKQRDGVGTGMGSLKKLVDRKLASAMTIVTGKAMIKYEAQGRTEDKVQNRRLINSLHGTMISWKFDIS